MAFKFGRVLCVLALLCAFGAPAIGETRRHDATEPGDIVDRIIKFLKKLPVPHLPGVFDDTIVPPKP